MIDELEPLAAEGGLILDWHTCDAFPERWIDLVVVLQCDHTQLWDRLEKRFVSIAVVHDCTTVTCLLATPQQLPTQENTRKQHLRDYADSSRRSS